MTIIDDVIKGWVSTYRANVEEYFWEILKIGLFRCEVKYSDEIMSYDEERQGYIKSPKMFHVLPKIEELLFPQVLFVGLINDFGYSLVDRIDWKSVNKDTIRINDYDALLDPIKDCDCYKVFESLSSDVNKYISGEMMKDSEWDSILKGPLAERYLTKINEILLNELQITIKCIRNNKEKVEALANQLLKRSRLSMEDMKDILQIP